MDLSTYATVLPIVVICYLVGMGLKATDKVKNKYIPVILGITGGIVAIPAMYLMEDFPASDIVTAIAVGIMSGLASTGVNQVYKQANRNKDEEQETGENV
jgi:ribonucleotide monophosphatase NagD (HAD superfamily)